MVAGPHCCGLGEPQSLQDRRGCWGGTTLAGSLEGPCQIDVRVKPAVPDIAQCWTHCALRHSCRFMCLRPARGFSSQHTVNLTTVKTRLKGRLRMVGWQAGLSASFGIKKTWLGLYYTEVNSIGNQTTYFYLDDKPSSIKPWITNIMIIFSTAAV